MVERIKTTDFSGAGNVFNGVLARTLRGLSQDINRMKIDQFSDLTDSSTGTAAYATGIVAQTGDAVAAFTETGTASAPKAGFDTAIGKIANAQAVLARYMNQMNAVMGLPLIVDNTGGTVATAGTIPALDLTLTAVSSNCLDLTTGRLRLESIKDNTRKLVQAANRIAVAVGETKITVASGMKYEGGETITLEAISASSTAVDGTADSTIADSVVDAELTAIANNIATLALFINDMTGAQIADLTDSTGGDASDTALVAQTIPSAAAGAATTSAPKAGFDTELADIEDGLSELTFHTNWLLRRNNQSGLLTDSTGVTVNGTMPAISTNLTAVDGSSGTNALDVTSATARMTTVANALSSIAAKVNVLLPLYGLPVITDNVGGTVSTTIANLANTDTGVGSTEEVTMLDSDVDGWLALAANNLATLAAKVNAMVTSTNTGAHLVTGSASKVTAWDA